MVPPAKATAAAASTRSPRGSVSQGLADKGLNLGAVKGHEVRRRHPRLIPGAKASLVIHLFATHFITIIVLLNRDKSKRSLTAFLGLRTKSKEKIRSSSKNAALSHSNIWQFQLFRRVLGVHCLPKLSFKCGKLGILRMDAYKTTF